MPTRHREFVIEHVTRLTMKETWVNRDSVFYEESPLTQGCGSKPSVARSTTLAKEARSSGEPPKRLT